MSINLKDEFKFKISQDMLEIYPLSKETYIAKIVEKDIYKITLINSKTARVKYYDKEQIANFISTCHWIVLNDNEE